MSVEVRLRMDVRTPEEMVEAVEAWMKLAPQLDRLKFTGWIVGFAARVAPGFDEEMKPETERTQEQEA